MAKCKATTTNGFACKAEALAGSDLCFFHNPKSRGARRAAQSRGGRKKVRPSLPTLEFDLSRSEEILKLLSAAARLTLAGQLNPKAGNALVGLCDAALRASHAIAVVEKIKQLEQEQRAEKALPFDPSEYLPPVFEEELEDSEPTRAEHEREDSQQQEKPVDNDGKEEE